MGRPKHITTGDENNGIIIEYVKSKKVLNIWGWYDHYVGIKPEKISLKDFCEELGITEKDLKGINND